MIHRVSLAVLVLSMSVNAWLLWRIRTARTADTPRIAAAGGPRSPGNSLNQKAKETPGPQKLDETVLPPSVERALAKERIYERLRQRRSEMLAARQQSGPWWTLIGKIGTLSLSRAEQQELRDLENTARFEVLNSLGAEALDPDGRIQAKYSFIAPEKALRLEWLRDDHASVMSDVDRAKILRLDSSDKRAMLDAEFQKDADSLLSKDELRAFVLQASPLAVSLRNHVYSFSPSHSEYTAIIDSYLSGEGAAAAMRPIRPGATNLVSVSAERAGDWRLANDSNFNDISRTAQRNGGGLAEARSIHHILEAASAAAAKAAASEVALGDGTAEFIRRQAAEAERQIVAVLGPTGTQELVLNNARWFEAMRAGTPSTLGSRVSLAAAETESRENVKTVVKTGASVIRTNRAIRVIGEGKK